MEHKLTVILITNCSHRKKTNGEPRALLRSIDSNCLISRVNKWNSKLEAYSSNKIPAKQLYAGDHWSVINALPSEDSDQGLSLQKFICSAGYGLIPDDFPISPYSATFSTGDPDSICRGLDSRPPKEINMAWWDLIYKLSSITTGYPRTIQKLAASQPNALFLISMSPVYLHAVHYDLINSLCHLKDRENLVIISTGLRHLEGLTEHLLPVDSRLQGIYGGAKISLNSRIAREIINMHPDIRLRLTPLKRYFSDLMGSLQKVPSPKRKKMSDEEICHLIKDYLTNETNWSNSRLLRHFRNQGIACEQKRFGHLYKEVKESLYA